MLTIDDLRAVKRLVTHLDCPDGIASALIVRDALPNLPVTFVTYNTAAWRELPVEPGMLFVDMTPPEALVPELVQAGAIVLDHHKGQQATVEAFGERGVFADEEREPGISGAVLAYRHVWAPIANVALHQISWPRKMVSNADTLDFAMCAGIRDTWQRKSPDWREACAQAAALRFWPTEMLLADGLGVVIGQRLDIGDVLLAKDEARDTKSIAEGHRVVVDGVRVFAFEGLWTSDIAERLSGQVDLVMGWSYLVEDQRPRMCISLRSRGDFSALAMAKRYGGGGHEHAAGFSVDVPTTVSPFRTLTSGTPYQAVQRMVQEHLDDIRYASGR